MPDIWCIPILKIKQKVIFHFNLFEGVGSGRAEGGNGADGGAVGRGGQEHPAGAQPGEAGARGGWF